jgi:hypothetical protein
VGVPKVFDLLFCEQCNFGDEARIEGTQEVDVGLVYTFVGDPQPSSIP